MKKYTHEEIQAAIDWLEESARKDLQEAAAIHGSGRWKNFCGYNPDTIDYWKWSIAYWQLVRDDARLNQDDIKLKRSEKGLRLCIGETRRLLGY